MRILSKHTPGPLEVRSLEGVWSVFEVKTLALTASCPDGPETKTGSREVSADEALANANLYAAAPDLLEACEHVRNNLAASLRGHYAEQLGAQGIDIDDVAADRIERHVEKNINIRTLDAAIAKAEGRA